MHTTRIRFGQRCESTPVQEVGKGARTVIVRCSLADSSDRSVCNGPADRTKCNLLSVVLNEPNQAALGYDYSGSALQPV